MNDKLIFEIGDIIHIKYKASLNIFKREKLTPQEIMDSHEFKRFMESYPELKRLCLEEVKDESI